MAAARVASSTDSFCATATASARACLMRATAARGSSPEDEESESTFRPVRFNESSKLPNAVICQGSTGLPSGGAISGSISSNACSRCDPAAVAIKWSITSRRATESGAAGTRVRMYFRISAGKRADELATAARIHLSSRLASNRSPRG